MQKSSHTVGQEVAGEAAGGECASACVPHIWRQAVCWAFETGEAPERRGAAPSSGVHEAPNQGAALSMCYLKQTWELVVYLYLKSLVKIVNDRMCGLISIMESVDSICRDSMDTQYNMICLRVTSTHTTCGWKLAVLYLWFDCHRFWQEAIYSYKRGINDVEDRVCP